MRRNKQEHFFALKTRRAVSWGGLRKARVERSEARELTRDSKVNLPLARAPHPLFLAIMAQNHLKLDFCSGSYHELLSLCSRSPLF